MSAHMRPVAAFTAPRSLTARALLGALLVGLALPVPAMAAPSAGGDDLVSVIVSFNGRPGRDGKQAVKDAGGRIKDSFQLIDAVSAELPRGRMAALERNPRVQAVEIDHPLRAFDHGANTGNAELEAAWGVEHIGAGDVHAAGNAGQGMKVGVIDTGIDYTHPDLNDNYAGGYDFFNSDPDPMDDHGHGTHVTGSLAAEANGAGVVGVAPNADIYAYKVLDANGSGDYSHMIAALERAVRDDVDVVNMSLGGTVDTVALHNAVTAAYNAGVVLVAASGNVSPSGQACPVAYPAAYEQVFATTFTGPDDALTGYSCTGPQVDFASPGDYINSTVPPCPMAMCSDSGYTNLASGTSMASPHLAGTVALVLAHGITNAGDPATKADDVKAHLCANTSVGTGVTYFGFWHVPISPTDPRYPDWFGCGVVDANKALLTNPPPTDGGPSNSAPVAADDTATVTEDGGVSVAVLANDTDPDADALSVTSVSAAAHGTAVADGTGGVLYTPAPNYSGSDSFSYEVSDGELTDSATVTVTVTPVNDTPVANADSASTSEARPVTINVLANDTDQDGDILAIASLTQPAHGTASSSGGAATYSPNPGFSGADSFTYTASDGHGGTATATVNVSVSATPRQMHVGDLDGLATRQTTRWTAKATIGVHNSLDSAVANVTVRGVWSTGETAKCTTGTGGRCAVSRTRISTNRANVTFQVTSISKSGWAYLASANHDPDGDSNGTTLVIVQP